MKQFEEILKRQEEGEFGGLWDEINEYDKRLLPAESKSTLQLNNCLQKLYSTELKQHYDLLENIAAGKISASNHDLDNILQKISSAEETAKELLSYGYKRPSAFRKIAQTCATAKMFDKTLAHLIEKTCEQFSLAYSEMKGWAELKEADRISEKRMILNHLVEQFKEYDGLCAKRKIKPGVIPKEMSRFIENMSQVCKLEKEIALLPDKLDCIDFDSSESRQQLKKLYAGNFKGIFRKTLVDRCRQAEYYEGQILAEYLRCHIEYLISNFGEIRKAWIHLCQDIDDLNELVKYSASEDLEKLKKLRGNFDPGKYNSYSALPVMAFPKKINEYKELVSQFYDAVFKRIKEEKIKEAARLAEQAKEAQAIAEREAKKKAELEKKIEEERARRQKEIEEKTKELERKERMLAEERAKAESKEKKLYKTLSAKLSVLDERIKRLDEKPAQPSPQSPQAPQVIIQYIPQPQSPEPERKAAIPEPRYDFVSAVQELPYPASFELHEVVQELKGKGKAFGLVDRVLEAGKMLKEIKPGASPSRTDYYFIEGLRDVLKEAMHKPGQFKDLLNCGYSKEEVYGVIAMLEDYMQEAGKALKKERACA